MVAPVLPAPGLKWPRFRQWDVQGCRAEDGLSYSSLHPYGQGQTQGRAGV